MEICKLWNTSIGIFIHFLLNISIKFLRVNFRTFYCFVFGWVFLAMTLLLCVFVNVLHVCLFLLILMTIMHCQVLFLFSFILISIKMLITFKVIITFLQMIYGYFCQFHSYSWKFCLIGIVTWSQDFVFLIIYMLLYLHKQIEVPDCQEAVRSCSWYQFFSFDYIYTCEDIKKSITKLTVNQHSIAELKHKNSNSFFQFLLVLGDISLNPGPVHQGTLQCSNELIAYILCILILIVCYQKLRNFVILQNLLILPL